MARRKLPIVALIYDFDGTLSPGNMQEFGFIQAAGSSPEEFWQESNKIADTQDASDILSYMKLMADSAKAKGLDLTREKFMEFGRGVELYDGVTEWFGAVNRYGKEHGVIVEHYINSSGLAEMIEGTEIAREFKKIFACSFMYGEDGKAIWPAVAVDYTAKTQFLFKINKGILSVSDSKLVNESLSDDKKRIPFSNMIYIGDGATDVPCMKITKMFGGHSIAIYDRNNTRKKDTAARLYREKRVNFMAPADYRSGQPLFNIVTRIIDKIKSDTNLREVML